MFSGRCFKEHKRFINIDFAVKGQHSTAYNLQRSRIQHIRKFSVQIDQVKMASLTNKVELILPALPAEHNDFISHMAAQKDKPMHEILEPYKEYDAQLRKVFAQQSQHPATQIPNVVPVFAGHEKDIVIRARNIGAESDHEKESYIMPLSEEKRRPNGAPALVKSLDEFRTNFNLFSESALIDLDWSNVVAAGSSVVTPLLAVPEAYSGTKRALREYYHEKLAPASDVDLFLYGLSEEEAKAKIEVIEQSIRDAILTETTTVRTKHAITIVSQYPTRHIQIVLRIYKSVSEILTGFDVDCSCAAYDGKQVYAAPRALAAYVTQINTIDLTRRSPSYENRLSKYAHRGFEVYWPHLDRSRVDPTIYERSFGRTEGLARLLVLEKLPKSRDRESYLDQRRRERGRPEVNRWLARRHQLRGNIKNDWEDEVAEWVEAEDVSDYHTFTIPYGPKFHAKKIEKLLYTKDILLNAEWNTPKDREVNLHRHPAFFGTARDVFGDCCGFCPKPSTPEEEEVAEVESKIYVSGEIEFMKDDPGRQTIGSFNPLSPDDWTEMAYIGNTARLCQAIVDGDLEFVQAWLDQEGNDPNTRDYTGRSPLHLAALCSTPEILQALIDHGARLVARLIDGRTALHIAAMQGNVEMVSALLKRSEANEEAEEARASKKREARAAEMKQTSKSDSASRNDTEKSEADDELENSDEELSIIDDGEEDESDLDATTEGSAVKVKPVPPPADDEALQDDAEDEPDVYDINVLAWDSAASPLHLAIINGHVDVVRCLVQEFGADILLPIKLFNDHDKSARGAILTMVLALQLPLDVARNMTKVLLELGASVAQADTNANTVLRYTVADQASLLDTMFEHDESGFKRAINQLARTGHSYNQTFKSVLMTAIDARDSMTALKLLTWGAKPSIDIEKCVKIHQEGQEQSNHFYARPRNWFEQQMDQPIITAINCELPDVAKSLIEDYGVDVNTLSKDGWSVIHNEYRRRRTHGTTVLDLVRNKIKELKEWTHKPDATIFEPIPLESDETYLVGIPENSYQYWSAQRQIVQAKERYDSELKAYNDRSKEVNDVTGVSEKQNEILSMLGMYQELESLLLQKSAKTFYELHSSIDEPTEKPPNYNYYNQGVSKPQAFTLGFTFVSQHGHIQKEGAELTEERAKQLEVFEAAWKGDLQAIKELTLRGWKNKDGEVQTPLAISDVDQHKHTPFSIAVLRGHLALAASILEIAQAQYSPKGDEKKRRFRLVRMSSECSDSDSENDDDFALSSEIVDDQFTIETIGEVSLQVKSQRTPLSLITQCFNDPDIPIDPSNEQKSGASKLAALKSVRSVTTQDHATDTESSRYYGLRNTSVEKRADLGPPKSVLQFALYNDDLELVDFLITLGELYTKAATKPNDDDPKLFFEISANDFEKAIEVDNPRLLAEILKRTGAGLPFNRLIKASGFKAKTNPKYYQGLSVYGKKRKDWVQSSRQAGGHYEVPENHSPPVLLASRYASLETLKWFLGDGPIRCYEEFADAHMNDKRIQSLAETQGGFRHAVTTFLASRLHLTPHCCILGYRVPESARLLEYLIKEMPKTIDSKSLSGITPLHLAFRYARSDLAELLIGAGADQTIRDKIGRNIVHFVAGYAGYSMEWTQGQSTILDVIDKRIVQELVQERCSVHPGALTPSALALENLSNHSLDRALAVMNFLCRYTGAKDLDLMNGEGNTPLHVAVRNKQPRTVEAILAQDPMLLHRENATGRTPLEMMDDDRIMEICRDAPTFPGGDYHYDSRGRLTRALKRQSNDRSAKICSRNPKFFVAGGDSIEDATNEEKIWKILLDTKVRLEDQGASKRRLVTLNEANEVARRLATMGHGNPDQTSRYATVRRYHRRGELQDEDPEELAVKEVRDEVDMWVNWRS